MRKSIFTQFQVPGISKGTSFNFKVPSFAKRLMLLVLLSSMGMASWATSYTTTVAGDLNNKSNWTPVPTNFTTQGDTWNITLPMIVATTWEVTGNVTIGAKGSINDKGKTINFNGHFTNDNDSGYIASGTAIFGSEFPQAIGGKATTVFNNVTRKSNGLSFNTNCVIKGDFIGNSFIVDNGFTIYFGGDFTVATGNNLFTGTAIFNGKQAQTVNGNPDFNNLTVSNAKGITLKSDEKILGDLTLAEGTLNDAGNVVSVAKNINGSGKEEGSGGVIMTGSNATISGVSIENLTLSNVAGFTLTGDAIISGALTFKAGGLSIGNYKLTLNGTVVGMDGTRSLTGGESSNIVIGSKKDLGTLFFNQLNQSKTNSLSTLALLDKGASLTLGNKLFINDTLALKAGSISDGGNVITLNGIITGTGAESGTGGINMKGSSSTISGITVGKLELSNSTDFSLTGGLTILDALVMTAGTLTVGDNTLTLNGKVSGMSVTNYLTGGINSNLSLCNNGLVDLLFFDQNYDGVSNNIANLTIAGNSILKLGNKMVSGKSLVITKGQLAFNDQTLVLNGTFIGTANDNIQGSNLANLIINTKGNVGPLYFDQTNKGKTDNIATFSINTGAGLVILGSSLSINNELALKSGTLSDGGNAITVNGNITGSGTESGAGGVIITGTPHSISGVTVANLTIKVSSLANLSGNLIVSNKLIFESGKLNIGENTLTLNGSVEGMTRQNSLIGSPASSLTIGSNGALGTVYLDASVKGNTNALASLNILNDNCNVSFAGTVVVGSQGGKGKHKKHKK